MLWKGCKNGKRRIHPSSSRVELEVDGIGKVIVEDAVLAQYSLLIELSRGRDEQERHFRDFMASTMLPTPLPGSEEELVFEHVLSRRRRRKFSVTAPSEVLDPFSRGCSAT